MDSKNGSGWVLDRVIKTYVNIGGYKPLKGKSYIPLPKGLIGRCHGIINIRNEDHMCVVWSVLAHLHPSVDHPNRVNQYMILQHELDLSGIEIPVKLGQIPKFERLLTSAHTVSMALQELNFLMNTCPTVSPMVLKILKCPLTRTSG